MTDKLDALRDEIDSHLQDVRGNMSLGYYAFANRQIAELLSALPARFAEVREEHEGRCVEFANVAIGSQFTRFARLAELEARQIPEDMTPERLRQIAFYGADLGLDVEDLGRWADQIERGGK